MERQLRVRWLSGGAVAPSAGAPPPRAGVAPSTQAHARGVLIKVLKTVLNPRDLEKVIKNQYIILWISQGA